METTLEILENKIRQSVPELREEYEILQESAIDADMITPIMLNHVFEYSRVIVHVGVFCIDSAGEVFIEDRGRTVGVSDIAWNLKSAYLKHQSEELIHFLNELK